jgi:hypothetical protein
MNLLGILEVLPLDMVINDVADSDISVMLGNDLLHTECLLKAYEDLECKVKALLILIEIFEEVDNATRDEMYGNMLRFTRNTGMINVLKPAQPSEPDLLASYAKALFQ